MSDKKVSESIRREEPRRELSGGARRTLEGYERNGFAPWRIESVTEQLRQISRQGSREVLEVGIAGGFLRQCLKLWPEVSHTTLDVAAELRPDHVGSVTEMPFADGQFDMVVCCQVLEHLPFECFGEALREIGRVTRQGAIISLPDGRWRLGAGVCLPRLGWLKWELNWPKLGHSLKPYVFDGEHHWEIGHRGSGGRRVRKCMGEAGLRIEREWRLEGNSWHCFFLLEKE